MPVGLLLLLRCCPQLRSEVCMIIVVTLIFALMIYTGKQEGIRWPSPRGASPAKRSCFSTVYATLRQNILRIKYFHIIRFYRKTSLKKTFCSTTLVVGSISVPFICLFVCLSVRTASSCRTGKRATCRKSGVVTTRTWNLQITSREFYQLGQQVTGRIAAATRRLDWSNDCLYAARATRSLCLPTRSPAVVQP